MADTVTTLKNNKAREEKHIRGLYGLRGIAASCVVLHHTGILNTHLGSVAIFLFFVLSGYLITGILLRSRTEIEEHKATVGSELRRFWINRIFRIFPVYYVMLLIVFSLSIFLSVNAELTSNILWYLLYAENFLIIFKTHHWGVFTPAWTLAIEQQFYVLFPFIALIVSRRHARVYIMCLYLLCTGSVLWLFFKKAELMEIYLLPMLGFMFIFTGSFISTLPVKGLVGHTIIQECLIGIVGWILLTMAILPESNGVWSIYLPIPNSIAFFYLNLLCGIFLWCILRFQKSIFVRILEKPLLKFMGRISFALYLVHVPLSYIIRNHISGPYYHLKLFLCVYLAAIVFATGSLYLLEHPLLKMKKKFLFVSPLFIPANVKPTRAGQ